MHLYYKKPIGIIYQHNPQFNHVIKELHRRGVNIEVINPSDYVYDPSRGEFTHSLLFNDLSSPPYLERKLTGTIQALEFIKHAETFNPNGRIINGSRASEILVNRSRQLSLFAALEIPFPKTRIVSSVDQLLAAVKELRFPLLIKANQFIDSLSTQVFENISDLIVALVNNKVVVHSGRAIIVQELVPAKGQHIVRAEILNGKVLYAFRIFHVVRPGKLPLEVKAEFLTLSDEITHTIEKIARAAQIDVGGIEYVIHKLTNDILFTELRPHTNIFGITIEGLTIDPIGQFVDYIERRHQKVREIALAI
jgi:glutathione synthase/RimK-type ligase-like ATP-grasp enzyme